MSKSKYLVELASESHQVNDMAAIERMTAPPGDEWTVAKLRQCVTRDSSARAYIARLGDITVGFAIGVIDQDVRRNAMTKRQMEVVKLASAPGWRRKGVAAKLMDQLYGSAERNYCDLIIVRAPEGSLHLGLHRFLAWYGFQATGCKDDRITFEKSVAEMAARNR
jgi:GNAT superfamily N-acetyltransferase